MGSLPNLSEIKDDDVPRGVYSFRNDRCKIRYRQSERGYFPRRKNPVFEDVNLQQTAASSPASARSTHLNHIVRRKDSLTSSIGATSVRRLISVVRNSHHRPGPHYNQKALIRYLLIFCVSHLFLNATFPQFVVLQGSVSLWTLHTSFLGINLGSGLLGLMYALAAISTIFSPFVLSKLGANVVLLHAYAIFVLFYTAHLYPVLWILIPAYTILGLAFGQISLCYFSILMGLSTKMTSLSEYDDEVRLTRRAVVVRRFARAIQASQDLGLILGSLMVALVIGCWQYSDGTKSCFASLTCTNGTTRNCTDFYLENIDSIFDIDEHGNRICGASACASNFPVAPIVAPALATVLLVIFGVLSSLALCISLLGLGKVKTCRGQDGVTALELTVSLKAMRDAFTDVKLQLVAPLAVFIGMEQAFIYTDFSKSYIVCTLGIKHLNLVFLSMGVLQSIAACTLSMLLKSIQRYYVVVVGFIFQCCVLMVQILWKPMNDDPALFYVIPAVWGVCNAIWEILILSLLTSLYTETWSAPFSISIFFRFLGLSTSFIFHSLLCNWIKLYVLSIVMLLSVIPYFCLEIRLARRKNIETSRL
ncbi:hypothetical protein RN001_010411 [Aquatica leii]|uniref:UNC93-like protein n=1 Tax=Aquatica leii TaxID=1421715 RepID=A0AAN7SQB1_9COLE|nr:hypothetical protein RN001_010411 [Aquatica leii]